MKKMLLSLLLLFTIGAQAQTPKIKYGDNPEAGHYATVNGIKMYYETYGEGKPLLLLHGNGGSIKGHTGRIEHFKSKYKVIAVDSRAHGKTQDPGDTLTYEKMTADINALLDYLKIDSCYVWGQSDGGIIGLELAIDYPKKVKRLAVFGANVQPDSTAVFPELLRWVDKTLATAKNDNERRLLLLLKNHPHIEYAALAKIKVPVLVMSGDRDAIKLEHSIKIFQNIPKANLFIMPGATHFGSYEKTDLFFKVLDDFFTAPFSTKATTDILK
ncbi:alpha/beta fold hydrolase [Flavobacterium sp.]|uniref:alpha/beta fold hydrolase n=1 Tax=Flavobacterium sp. TaxID=239 RepID=UPI0039E3D743